MDDPTEPPTTYSSRDFQCKAMKDPRYADTKSTEASTASRRIKDEVYVPWLISRLTKMHGQGLPIPVHWLDPNGELLKLVNVQVDPKLASAGLYSPKPIAFILRKEIPEKMDLKPFSGGRILVHEMFHFLAGTDITLLDNVPTVTRSSGFGGSNDTQKTMAEDLLLEATTEALTRWAISELNADFAKMTAEEFFKGPKDVPPDAYIHYQNLMGRVFKDVPALTILKPYFEDGVSLNGPRAIGEDRQRLDETIDKKVRGGWEGLSQLQKLAHGFYPKKLPLESLATRPWLIAAKHLRRVLSKSIAEAVFEHLVTNWEREQQSQTGEVDSGITPEQVDDKIPVNVDKSLTGKVNGSGISRSGTPELEVDHIHPGNQSPEVIRDGPLR